MEYAGKCVGLARLIFPFLSFFPPQFSPHFLSSSCAYITEFLTSAPLRPSLSHLRVRIYILQDIDIFPRPAWKEKEEKPKVVAFSKFPRFLLFPNSWV